MRPLHRSSPLALRVSGDLPISGTALQHPTCRLCRPRTDKLDRARRDLQAQAFQRLDRLVGDGLVLVPADGAPGLAIRVFRLKELAAAETIFEHGVDFYVHLVEAQLVVLNGKVCDVNRGQNVSESRRPLLRAPGQGRLGRPGMRLGASHGEVLALLGVPLHGDDDLFFDLERAGILQRPAVHEHIRAPDLCRGHKTEPLLLLPHLHPALQRHAACQLLRFPPPFGGTLSLFIRGLLLVRAVGASFYHPACGFRHSRSQMLIAARREGQAPALQ
mmetsp:Transcript_8924/g.26646  ORF Transcript_8924/g.26646 Transcript_8924/m.26646 type:complete len:274 (+) Transcript_8924:1487-2308(+)